jgi:hypothetical protein
MSSNNATRKDVDDILSVLDTMMNRIDDRFIQLEESDSKTRSDIQKIMNNLDSFVKNKKYPMTKD